MRRQPLPAAVQVVLLRFGLPLASQPSQGAQDVSQLGFQAVYHRVTRRYGPEENGRRGRPGGFRHAAGPAAAGKRRRRQATAAGNGRGQRPGGGLWGRVAALTAPR